jgi:8-oxo-dGTP diphosphatase
MSADVSVGTASVRAAGGVVVRGAEDPDRPVEVLVVHRPRYDDWTFPKGKGEPGETDEDTARREVEEETGLRCRLGPELPATRYTDGRGRDKVVRYWRMQVDAGSFRPNHEVDAVEWLPPDVARARLTYEHDRDVLDAALGTS